MSARRTRPIAVPAAALAQRRWVAEWGGQDRGHFPDRVEAMRALDCGNFYTGWAAVRHLDSGERWVRSQGRWSRAGTLRPGPVKDPAPEPAPESERQIPWYLRD